MKTVVLRVSLFFILAACAHDSLGTKSLEMIAMRVVTGTSYWTVVFCKNCWLGLLGWQSCWAGNSLLASSEFLWTYWGQWHVSRGEYASRYGRDQHVACVAYESRIHRIHAWNLPQVERSKFQWNVSIGGHLGTKLDPLHTLENNFW